jgi:hypothetical protein
MVAEPMFLAFNPEMVPESNFTGRGDGVCCAMAASELTESTASIEGNKARKEREREIFILIFPL